VVVLKTEDVQIEPAVSESVSIVSSSTEVLSY